MQPTKTTLVIILAISLLTRCTSNNSSAVPIEDANIDSIETSTNIEAEFITYDNALDNDSVDVAINVTQPIHDIFDLNVDFKIYGGGWILSPLELDYPYGITKISFAKNKFLSPIESIIEVPNSTFKTDENFDTPYRVITEHTTLTKKMKVTSKNDFIVEAEFSFIHEPICTPNKITFNIIQKAGVISIQSFFYNYGTKLKSK